MDKSKHLDSWKEIAAYLGRTIRTCQVWERELGLPVHRLDGSPKARVFAYMDELDSWLEQRGHLPQSAEEVLAGLGKIESGIPPPAGEIGKGKPFTSKEITVKFSVKRVLLPALAFLGLIVTGPGVLEIHPPQARRPPPRAETLHCRHQLRESDRG